MRTSCIAADGIYRIVAHPADGGWHAEVYCDGIGWVLCDDMPDEVEHNLCVELGLV